ncbi:MAG: hypothetical protein K9N48_07780 [Verrucomicrobia bacterium]|nr:hypothetical protein [Verrucomicrobiota bacterium]MCF7708031.1 hypothetical protein [Verrucomicrobiota bacterium]
MKMRYIVYAIVLAGLFVLAIWQSRTPTVAQKTFLHTMQNLPTLRKMVIRQDSGSDKREIIITNVEVLSRVHNSLQQSDLRPVSGHSGAIYESEIRIFSENNQVIKVRGTVHKYEPEDVYLSPDLLHEMKPGEFVSIGIPDRIRVPRLGKWIMSITASTNGIR